MPAIVTDKFRILNTNNFVDSIEDSSNSYYIFLGLPNPEVPGFGRNSDWDRPDLTIGETGVVPNPTDNDEYSSQYRDTSLFGKKITSANVRRVVRKIDWSQGTKYDMYRHDYSTNNLSSVTKRSRLYDANYYVLNSDYKVYICLDNGSSGINTTGNSSQDEPTFIDLEPSKAGESGDGYVWKYLFTVPPGDIVKFDSTEYITLPNNWQNSTDPQIISIRENSDSFLNNNQIKKVYIENSGLNYSSGPVNILGDGEGGEVFVETNQNGQITNVNVTSGGSGYTYGIIDLGSLQPPGGSIPFPAKLIPIIPPSRGHGYDLYSELGADRVLLYSRFDDSTKDFPIDTKFCQIGVLKNPSKFSSEEIYIENQFSSLYSIKFSDVSGSNPDVGEIITQLVPSNIPNTTAYGYVASYDATTKVLKYFKERSLHYNSSTYDATDYINVSIRGDQSIQFSSSGGSVTGTTSGFSGNIDASFSGITTTTNGQIINLASQFINGLSNPEINRKTGDILYIDNRALVSRSSRQKEDIKIILEF
jgi:hypothetical protein